MAFRVVHVWGLVLWRWIEEGLSSTVVVSINYFCCPQPYVRMHKHVANTVSCQGITICWAFRPFQMPLAHPMFLQLSDHLFMFICSLEGLRWHCVESLCFATFHCLHICMLVAEGEMVSLNIRVTILHTAAHPLSELLALPLPVPWSSMPMASKYTMTFLMGHVDSFPLVRHGGTMRLITKPWRNWVHH